MKILFLWDRTVNAGRRMLRLGKKSKSQIKDKRVEFEQMTKTNNLSRFSELLGALHTRPY